MDDDTINYGVVYLNDLLGVLTDSTGKVIVQPLDLEVNVEETWESLRNFISVHTAVRGNVRRLHILHNDFLIPMMKFWEKLKDGFPQEMRVVVGESVGKPIGAVLELGKIYAVAQNREKKFGENPPFATSKSVRQKYMEFCRAIFEENEYDLNVLLKDMPNRLPRLSGNGTPSTTMSTLITQAADMLTSNESSGLLDTLLKRVDVVANNPVAKANLAKVTQMAEKYGAQLGQKKQDETPILEIEDETPEE